MTQAEGTVGQTYRLTQRQANRHTGRLEAGQAGTHTDTLKRQKQTQTAGQTGRQADRQADTHWCAWRSWQDTGWTARTGHSTQR